MVRRATRTTERLRILLSGDAKTGKTTSLETLPPALRAIGVAKPKIVILDIDQNADDFMEREDFEVYRFGGIPGTDHESSDAVHWFINNVLKKRTDINVVVGDSITALSMAALAKIAYVNNRLGEPLQIQDWNHEMWATKQMCLDLQNLQISHAVITMAHTDLAKDDASGRTYNRLVLTGKLPKQLIKLFPEIYWANITKRAGKSEFKWQTIPDPQTAACTQIKAHRLEAGIEQDFGPVFKAWFAGRQEEEKTDA